MAKAIYSGADCANMYTSGTGSNSMSELSISNDSAVAKSHMVRGKPQHMEDILYGKEDHEEISDDYMYKEDVVESMRRERDFKALKKRQQKKFWNFFECFEFLRLLGGAVCINFWLHEVLNLWSHIILSPCIFFFNLINFVCIL